MQTSLFAILTNAYFLPFSADVHQNISVYLKIRCRPHLISDFTHFKL